MGLGDALGEFFFDEAVDAGLGELCCNADAIADGAVVGGAVTDDADAADAEQGCSAVLGGVSFALEGGEGLAREQRADLGGDGLLERILEHVADEAGEALGGLEGHIAHKTIADDDVGVPVVDVAAFDIADEVERQTLDEGESLSGKLVAFAFFFADGEQADAGTGDLEHGTRVELAHDGELGEVLWATVDIGANIEQYAGGSGGGGQDSGQGGAIDAGERAENHFGRDHGGTRVAGGQETGGVALADELEPDAHGAVFFIADCRRSFFVHADVLTGVDDFNGQFFAVERLLEKRAQGILRADEEDLDRKLTCSLDSSTDFRIRRLVGTHGINGDNCQHANWGLAGFLGLKHSPALVGAALAADTVGQLALVAAGALGETRGGEKVMGTALGRAGLGVAAFRIRHGEDPFKSFRKSLVAVGVVRGEHGLPAGALEPAMRRRNGYSKREVVKHIA
jgi:hypothetical protein